MGQVKQCEAALSAALPSLNRATIPFSLGKKNKRHHHLKIKKENGFGVRSISFFYSQADLLDQLHFVKHRATQRHTGKQMEEAELEYFSPLK